MLLQRKKCWEMVFKRVRQEENKGHRKRQAKQEPIYGNRFNCNNIGTDTLRYSGSLCIAFTPHYDLLEWEIWPVARFNTTNWHFGYLQQNSVCLQQFMSALQFKDTFLPPIKLVIQWIKGLCLLSRQKFKKNNNKSLIDRYQFLSDSFETLGVLEPCVANFLRKIEIITVRLRNELRELGWLLQRVSPAICRGNAIAVMFPGRNCKRTFRPRWTLLSHLLNFPLTHFYQWFFISKMWYNLYVNKANSARKLFKKSR